MTEKFDLELRVKTLEANCAALREAIGEHLTRLERAIQWKHDSSEWDMTGESIPDDGVDIETTSLLNWIDEPVVAELAEANDIAARKAESDARWEAARKLVHSMLAITGAPGTPDDYNAEQVKEYLKGVQAERDAARANSAAFREALEANIKLFEGHNKIFPQNRVCSEIVTINLRKFLAKPNPGAPLLEELERLRNDVVIFKEQEVRDSAELTETRKKARKWDELHPDLRDGMKWAGELDSAMRDGYVAENTRLREAAQFAVDNIPGDVGSSKTGEAVDKLEAALNAEIAEKAEKWNELFSKEYRCSRCGVAEPTKDHKCGEYFNQKIDTLQAKNTRLREAIKNVPTNEYGNARREGCDSSDSWDFFCESLGKWRKAAFNPEQELVTGGDDE